MSELLIIGAGGHASVVADAALTSGRWNSVCFVDDLIKDHSVLGFKVVGTSADLDRLVGSFPAAVVAIGNVRARLELLSRCETLGFELPTVVHHSAVVSRFSTIGHGTVVFAQAAVNPRALVGRGCIINTGATVDHDCDLGEGVHICPGVHLAGNVSVGARSWIGIGTSVRQGLHIGSDVTIGAGAAVISNIESGATAIGVPARVKRRES